MRNSKDLTDSLDSIMRARIDGNNSGDNSLPAPKQRGEAPAQKSSGVDVQKQAPSGGGIASPLTENAYSSRQFYPAGSVTSTDGLVVWEISAIKKTSFTDADGNSVVINWASPSS